jgi:phage tail P2-like protein
MNIATTLLPLNATDLEMAVAQTAARALPVPVNLMWNPETCPAAYLPWLAWALSVDEWDGGWAEERKREVIAASVEIHRTQGTVWAMRRALQIAGLGDAELVEQYGAQHYDGAISFDGQQTHAPQDHWAEYRVVLARPLTIEQADQVRRILEAAAPARCHLKALDFVQVQNLYDGVIQFDGAYSHGVA